MLSPMIASLAILADAGGQEPVTEPPAPVAPPVTEPVVPAPPETPGAEVVRQRMVAEQVQRRGVKDPAVLMAMRKVPRDLFLPFDTRAQAYDDRAIPIGYNQTISQPYVVGFMTEALALAPGDRVLEIGTGSGYQTAILAELVKEVFTIEIIEPLGDRAAEMLASLGYRNIRRRIGDGYRGWEEASPFDAIIVTCSPDAIPQPLVDQLAEGGRMIIPVGPRGEPQQLVLLRKIGGRLDERKVLPVVFVPMTGEAERHGP